MAAYLPLPDAGEALADVPLSPELMSYYRERLAASECEIAGLRDRVETCETSQAVQHKARWELHKRMEEITDLQKALSDSHVYLWDERERCQRLQAENDELKIQEVEDRRKIQHLLSMVEPVMQDVTYLRDGAPETMTLHTHARATTTLAPARATTTLAPASRSGRGTAAQSGGTGGGGHAGAPVRVGVPVIGPGEGPRVMRTVYLPNEKVDSLLLTIESLRTQQQQQQQLGRERVAALQEDRRLRIEEERQRRAVEAEKLQEAEAGVERMQSLVNKYTKDFLALKHEALQARHSYIYRSTRLWKSSIQKEARLYVVKAAALCIRPASPLRPGGEGAPPCAHAHPGHRSPALLRRSARRRRPSRHYASTAARHGRPWRRGARRRSSSCTRRAAAPRRPLSSTSRSSASRPHATRSVPCTVPCAVPCTVPCAVPRAVRAMHRVVTLPCAAPSTTQVTDTERTMGLLKDRHSGLQQALTMRVRELEEGSQRFKTKYRQLEERRRLEVEGFRSELDLLHRQVHVAAASSAHGYRYSSTCRQVWDQRGALAQCMWL